MKKLIVLLSLALVLTVTSPFLVSAASHDNSICFLGFCYNGSNINTDPNQNPFNQGSITGNSTTYTGSGSKANLSSLQNIILATSYFLNNIIIPFLFTIALLVFLVNAVRYFILDSGNQESRDKAKRLAFWGVAAFVLLVSIWGIVNLLVNNLGFGSTAAKCPDYLPTTVCQTKGIVGSNLSFGSLTTNPGISNGSAPQTGTTGTTGSAGNNTQSGIANLVFGTMKDMAILDFTSGTPRASQSTPVIADNATCSTGMQTLMLASEVEQNQTAYLLYADSSGAYHWLNLTDQNFPSGVTYDADTINTLAAQGAYNFYLIHTHQKPLIENSSLNVNGFAPSTADMKLMCDSVVKDMTHVTVDWSGVWVMDQQPSACPRSASEENLFPTIESLNLLSQVASGDRNQEFLDLYNSPLTPANYVTALDTYKTTNFDGMNPSEIYALTAPLLSQAQMTMTRTNSGNFCNNLGTSITSSN